MSTMNWEDKIAALLAKAESTTPEEAEALTAKAEELMIKYGIEQAVIDAKRATGAKQEAIVTAKINFAGIYSKGFIVMAHSIVTALGQLRDFQYTNVQIKNEKGKYVRGDQLVIIGFESDVKQAELLITSLQMQCIVALDAWWSEFTASRYVPSSDKYRERRSFIMSFGSGAGQRIRDTRRRVVKEETEKGTGTDLVLVDRKKQVDQYVEDTFNLRRSSGRGLTGGHHGSSAGRAAGANANVGQTGIAGGRRAVGR